jgi:hypothetical protein
MDLAGLPGNDLQATTVRSSRLQTSPHGRQARAAALRPTPAHHHHRRPRGPRTPVLAPCSSLLLPQFNLLHESYKRRQVAPPASSSSQSDNGDPLYGIIYCH